ncbi:MAG: nucleotide kinase domain-containing protein [Pseudomonadota bacterium]
MQYKDDIADNKFGKLFVFEGSDGVGKSTIAEKVAEGLHKKGADVLLLSFPGKEENSLGKLVYDLHHDTSLFKIDHISSTSLQILHIAAHIDCIEHKIFPALSEGKTVILDRYWWSTFAYGMAAGIPKLSLDTMIRLELTEWGNIKPDKLFLIARNKPFRVQLPYDQWLRICTAYEELTKEEMGRYPIEVIENSKPLKEITACIIAHIQNGIPQGGKNRTSLHKFSNIRHGYSSKHSKKDHWAPTKTTKVFDTYWRFAAERQAIFFKRLKSEKEPWTQDPILRTYKFTNVYRASDRVSQFLIRHVIYQGEQEPNEIFFRTLLFKTFNKIETWKLLVGELGQISWREYDFRVYDQILTKALENKRSIYSAAYIMPSGGSAFGHKIKHRNHLNLLQKMLEDQVPDRISNTKSMQAVFELLRAYPMIGDFLSYQYATDINYSILTDFSEMSFAMPGPGAKDGLQKCFSDFGGLSEVDLIKLTADRQKEEFARLGIQFQDLWGRPLQLIDCQNLFCEVDKYARIAHPEIKGITGRTRIKQKFRQIYEPIVYFYPPKWNINNAVNKTYSEEQSMIGFCSETP